MASRRISRDRIGKTRSVGKLKDGGKIKGRQGNQRILGMSRKAMLELPKLQCDLRIVLGIERDATRIKQPSSM